MPAYGLYETQTVMTCSWLFVPGDSSRKMERAFESGAEALIFDWEDAVAPINKDAARALLPNVLASSADTGPALYVRVNGLDTRFIDEDLAKLPLARIAGVVLPKSCGPGDVQRLARRLDKLERQAGVPGRHLEIVSIGTETAASVLSLCDFRQPMQRLRGLMWGGEDLGADIGVFRNRDQQGTYRTPFLLARNLTVFAAAATDSLAIDAVFTDFRNLEALEKECYEARRDGFSGKAAIHPDQIPVINAAFMPEEQELEWARRIQGSFKNNNGVAVLDGHMVDAPHMRLAARLLGLEKLG